MLATETGIAKRREEETIRRRGGALKKSRGGKKRRTGTGGGQSGPGDGKRFKSCPRGETANFNTISRKAVKDIKGVAGKRRGPTGRKGLTANLKPGSRV